MKGMRAFMLGGRKDLLGIKDLSAEEIMYILENAENMKQVLLQDIKKTAHLQGRSVVTLFYENSTRTRLSFELAAKYMSATAANVSASTSSVAKGETLIDTGRTIDMMGTDVIVIRHNCSGAPALLAKNVKASVINAGDGMNEHPTQALLDMLTIKEQKGNFSGLNVAIVGDITHSRVARSDIYALSKLGAKIKVCGPATMVPKGMEQMGVDICAKLDDALKNADVIIGLRMQLERQKQGLFPSVREYSHFFGVDKAKLALAKEDAIIMHPGPVNRGVELDTFTIDSSQSFINKQVTNGVAVRMAVLNIFADNENIII